MIFVFISIYIITIVYILYRYKQRRVSPRKLRALRQLQLENSKFLKSKDSNNYKYVKKRPKL